MAQNSRSDPRTSKKRAWEIVVNPGDFSKISRRHLIDRGVSYYETAQSIDEKELLTDVSEFVLHALERPDEEDLLSESTEFVDEPGRLALVASLGSILVRRHDLIKDNSRDPRIHEYVRELYWFHIFSASKHSPDKNVIRRSMGVLAYGRDKEDDYGPPVGNVIEGITRSEGDGRLYYKVPIVHANRQCEVKDEDGNLDVVIHGKYVYIPVDDVKDKYKRYFDGRGNVSKRIEDVVDGMISDERLNEFLEVIRPVNNKIEEFERLGKDHMLFQERKYSSDLKVILMAVENADPDDAKLGDELTTAEVADAVDEFVDETELDWAASVGKNMRESKQIAPKLSNLGSDPKTTHVTVVQTEGNKPNRYVLEYAPNDYNIIEVTEIGDLLEFPCFESLHESLQEGKPTRWELYSFVRYILEIDAVDFTTEEIMEWFSQYPWYREDVTEYQVDYEKIQDIHGDRPLPISCNNDNRNWSSHCIGMENCDYSLYQSVDLKPDVYDRLG